MVSLEVFASLYYQEYVVIKITIDTNVLIGGLDGDSIERELYHRLVEWHQQGIIEIAVSNRIEKDKETDKDAAKAYRHLVEATKFTEISSPFRVGVTQEHGIMGDESILQCLHDLRQVDYSSKNRNTLWDIDHLYGHFIDNRDWFLTYEDKIWKKRPFLARLRINVSIPNVFVSAVDRLIFDNSLSRETLRREIDHSHPGEIDKKYESKVNPIINRYLAVEQKELEQAKFIIDARNPQTELGSIISIISESLLKTRVIQQRENAFHLAVHLYPKFIADYKEYGNPYGDNTQGLIRWIQEIYDHDQFL